MLEIQESLEEEADRIARLCSNTHVDPHTLLARRQRFMDLCILIRQLEEDMTQILWSARVIGPPEGWTSA